MHGGRSHCDCLDPHHSTAYQRKSFLANWIKRSYGRSAIAFLCIASAAFEIWIKTNYSNEIFKPYFDIYMSFWPNLWTPGEALRTQKTLLPLVLAFVLFTLDVTVDRLPENPEDPLRVLNNITNRQDALITKGLNILEKVRAEMKHREPCVIGESEIPCKAEIQEL
jgi:hypothetical protein